MAYYKKEKKIRNISEFDGHKKLFQLNKPKSPVTILFCTKDLPDEWLIDVVEYRTQSGRISESYMIIAKQLEEYSNFCKSDGFTILTKLN